MNRKLISLVLALSFLLAAVLPVMAQTQPEEYRLNISRTFGYSSGNEIRGAFAISIVGPDNIRSVIFLIGTQILGTVNQKPFRLDIQTGDYAFGSHDLSAKITTVDGKVFTTNAKTFLFATPEQESQAITRIIFPLFGGILLVMVIIFGVQFLLTRNKPKNSLPFGAARQYGLAGGSICRHCHRPFARHWWAPNMLVGKLDRCDHCGKISIATRASTSQLAQAEADELKMGKPETPIEEKSAEEKMREMLDSSRFTE